MVASENSLLKGSDVQENQALGGAANSSDGYEGNEEIEKSSIDLGLHCFLVSRISLLCLYQWCDFSRNQHQAKYILPKKSFYLK